MPLGPPNNEGWPLPITWRAWRELGRSLAAHLISAMASFIGTFFCHPDAHLGFLFAGVAMGQGLSLPMMAVGVWMVLRGSRAAPRQHS
jgi:prolipoprotein diacylglyceryltransferase